MQYAYLQKQQIVADLLAVSGLHSVVPIDGVKDLLSMVNDGTFQNGLPAIVVPTPMVKRSTKIDSQHNDRVNTFEMYLIFDSAQLATPFDVEKMVDLVLNTFDQDQNLAGTSLPTIETATNGAMTLESGEKSYIVVTITLNAHALIDIFPGMDPEAGGEEAG